MKPKILLPILFFTAGLMLCSGCQHPVTPDIAPPKKMAEQDFAAAEELSRKYMQAFAKALGTGDFSPLAAELDLDMLELRDRKALFAKMCKSLERFGTLKDYYLLGTLNQSMACDPVWVLVFEKETESQEVPAIHTELIYIIRVMDNGNGPEIVKTGFRFL